MNKVLLFCFFAFSFFPVFAKHVTGGEIIYDHITTEPGFRTYYITLRLFRDNNTIGGAPLPSSVYIAVYNNENGSTIGGYRNVSLTSLETVPILAAPNCLTNSPNLDYAAGYYSTSYRLADNMGGYTASFQTCCRIDGIANTGNSIGATYTGSIPGALKLGTGIDNSPRFQTGISIICFKKRFTLDFSATDPDGDSLSYSMVNAYNGGLASNASFNEPAGPPYSSIPYTSPYSGPSPLGPLATINSNTGIISGTAPDAGKYVVCVVVKSYRNGVLISEHRKDFIITVAECDFATASLPAVIPQCDSYTKTFENQDNSALNLTFDWDFGDGTTSTNEVETHTYAAAGDYLVKLVVNRGTLCSDSVTSLVRVWPGFYPLVAPVPPTCKNIPIQFNDQTTADFGFINYWHWNFDDPQSSADTARIRNPVYTYNTPGTYNVELIVASSKGCIDTLYPEVTIVDKPDFHVPNDTLICVVDTLQLLSTTSSIGGTITWSPNYMISDIHSLNPFVSPDVTTTYTAFYQDPSGCSVTMSTTVNVANGVTLVAAADTTICLTDSVQLRLTNTNALYFQWTANPAAVINTPNIRNPYAFPVAPQTDFRVRASISNKCFSDENIIVRTVPYPIPSIMAPDSLCFGTSTFLHASGGSIYNWTPVRYLSDANIADPEVILPQQTITYTLSVRDTLGCPKPVTKIFTLNVIKIIANAGPQDTSIVLGQPLLLNATGSTNYLWTPDRDLTNASVANPVATPKDNITYTVRVSNSMGCFALDTINVKVFFLPPDVYVPSAFTPGGSDINDLFRPIALGIKSLENFRVYNRWGELVYATKRIGDGWNGDYKGIPQNPGTYVWQVDATDYLGKKIQRKGSVILIR